MHDAATERLALQWMERALDEAPADTPGRRAWLVAHAPPDPVLHERVIALLAADGDDSDTVATQVASLVAALVEEVAPAGPPAVVGVWRPEELIGSGGMGAVYRAHRADGLYEQEVAIKFVRRGKGHSALPVLMDEERRLLARMSHPGIARILDGGQAPDSTPYVVMELVRGVPLDRYVRDAKAGRAARVALLRQVCAAVAHAHSLGVLHNDLKPANVLVPADGQPKLIDFGVARLQGGASDRLPLGLTREYASPERLAGEPPTVADDVYALGVLLRGLLEDQPPDAELTAIAGRATAAARADRYPTVAALDEDLQRRQAEQPVRAVPATNLYRVRKLLRRRPWRVAAGAAAAGGMVVALGLTTALYWRAESARAEAQARFQQTREMARFMLFELDEQLDTVPGTTPVRRAVVARGQQYLDALAVTARSDRGLQREVAVGMRRLAEVQGVPGRANLGERDAALANLTRAEALLTDLLDEHAKAPGTHAPLHWQLQQDLGHVLYVRSLFSGDSGADYTHQIKLAQAAEGLLAQALQRAEAAGAPSEVLGELHTTLLGARLSQAFGLRFLDRHAEAGALQAAEEQRLHALPEAVRSTFDADFHLGRAPTQLGDSLYYQGRLEEALAAYRRGLERFEAGLARRPQHRKLLEGAQIGLWNVASTLGELKRHAEELQTIERALPISERLVELDPQNRNARHARFVITDHFGIALSNNGRWAQALRILEANQREREADAALAPDDGTLVRGAVVALRSIARVYQGAGDRRGECRTLGLALERWTDFERRFGLAPADLKTDVQPLRERWAQAGCPSVSRGGG